MSRTACPYCYHRIASHRLWYQCTGRGVPGRQGCASDVDTARQAETGFQGRSRPAYGPSLPVGPAPAKAPCPACGGESGIRVCPCCHTPLSPNFAGSRSPLIAMVGAKGTGKTVYLTVLAHELRAGLRRRFGADVRLSGDRQGDAASPLAWLQQNVDAVYDDRRLFAQTAQAQAGRREPLVFEWRQEHRRLGRTSLRTSYLSFYDTAGEDLTTQSNAVELAYLGAADALILLLDPFMLPQARQRLGLPRAAMTSEEATLDVVGRVTDALRVSHGVKPRKRIPIPVSVAFAKIDGLFDLLGPDHPLLATPPPVPHYDETAGQDTHERIRALLDELGADNLDAHLRLNYETFRYFGVSALGAPPDYEAGVVDPGGVRPHRVDEPLVWLLGGFGVVPVGRK
ncbi:hypothetical protein AB0M43_22080 [Longispora sp. NPDC051575]|uniref:hypothetical protein n=1 Tax=Longispora sp. NPDC051575 TaxID=3154943 RepID=UPI003423E926